jgi:branched-subunit amino acid transport protein AzlD
MNNGTDFIIIVIAVAVLIFILTRMLWLWYFKIDERTQLMREQNELLKAIFKQLGGNIEG